MIKHLKRAGLDYWPLVDVQVHENFAEVQEQYKGHHFYYLTTKSEQCYTDIQFTNDDLLVFGKGNKRAAGRPLEAVSRKLLPYPYGG